MNNYQKITVKPITGALGAEISNVDLSALEDPTFDEIYTAFLEHQVIFFRDQTLTPGDQVAFAKRFGDIHFHPYLNGMDEHPEILEIVREPGDAYTFGSTWHSDQMFNPRPAKATMLYAKETPPVGGDTLFASMYLAHDGLSEGMRRMLSNVKTWNDGDRNRNGRASRYANAKSMVGQMRDPGDLVTSAAHPLIRTHPETGRKGLYFGIHAQALEGFEDNEAKPLLHYLRDHSTRPEYTCRFRWKPGSLAIWDNRCVQHKALSDYTERRHMHRVTIAGDEPF
ncbi:MAG: TauD/TfdA family dioxygenase [Pseudomonadota bacterium]